MLLLTIKNNKNNYKLLLSASASLPLAYLTEEARNAPMTAPAFCMLLRKHLNGGKIVEITQPDMERVLHFRIEHMNELGDPSEKILIFECMGKHSNLILIDENGKILDSIKRIPSFVSSIREVLPGRDYFLPDTLKKQSLFTLTEEVFLQTVLRQPQPISKTISSSIAGISMPSAEEFCFRAHLDGGQPANTLSESEQHSLYQVLCNVQEEIASGAFSPTIYYQNRIPVSFASITMMQNANLDHTEYASVSELIFRFYNEREKHTRIRQKSTDLRKITTTLFERTMKKLILQKKQLKDTEKREKFRIYGELLTTYGYSLPEGAKQLETINYYTNEPITVPLDPTLSPLENANKYFAKYTKLKRTAEELGIRTKQTEQESEQLDSIVTALELADSEEDLQQIREELIQSGFIRQKRSEKIKKSKQAAPLHFISSDGFDIFVGKNNFQNEYVTFHLASAEDWWFHAKKMAGSHVIVKSNGTMPPDRTFEEAGKLAAYFSKGRTAPKVEIDYTKRKQLKRPNGGAPGFVIYHTNYSMMSEPEIIGIRTYESGQ